MVRYPKKTKKGTSEKLVETARKLFFRYGIKRVPVDEICREAGVSKMTFYRHFPDKTAVAMRILEDIFSHDRAKVREIEMLDIPFEAKLQRILEHKLVHTHTYSREFLTDLLKDADPSLERYIQDAHVRSLEESRRMFLAGQRTGEVRKDVKVEMMLHLLGMLREAVGSPELQALYPDLPSLMREAFTLFHYGALRRQT